MTLRERVDAYKHTFKRWPGSWPTLGISPDGRETMQAVWVIGNDYRNKTTFYGSYPRSYLDRVMAMYPDAGDSVLHAFSGSLPSGNYTRCDLVQDAELKCSVYDVASETDRRFRLILADPPYTGEDAKKYGTPMVNRGRATRSLAAVAEPGGHMVWLDTVWPMHSKSLWLTIGRIAVVRSTNHRVRMATVFERVA